MNDRWNILPNAPLVLQHADDARPAWLWSQDGQRLIWSNAAAGLFLAKLKKHGVRRASPAKPIRGQVQRTIRLGTAGRSSLARIQFLAGEKPASMTCATTPLAWENGEMALLIVGVDAIDAEILAAANNGGAETSLVDEGESDLASAADAHAPEASDAYPQELESWEAQDGDTGYETPTGGPVFDAGASDTAEDWQTALADDEASTPPPTEGVEEHDKDGDSEPASVSETSEDVAGPSAAGTTSRRLSELVDRLADNDALFAPLSSDDDAQPPSPANSEPAAWTGGTIEETEDENSTTAEALYRVTGRGFIVDAGTVENDAPSEVPPETSEADDASEPVQAGIGELTDIEPADPEAVERTSRYNFDELSRILTDRVGERGQTPAETPPPSADAPENPAQPAAGSLINLGGETLVLNRLPLGILVFRDQQVLFANRAITEMVGYDSVENLRRAGLAAVFPAAGPNGQEAGPVNHLVQQDGTLVPVTARLQSISWHGRPALMLSASATEVRTGHEDAVRAFAESYADLLGEGFIVANRTGTISAANAAAAGLLTGGKPATGRTVASLVGDDDVVALQAFLERPARFAETERPVIALRSGDGRAEILLFALGQAGLLSGYFGFVRARQTTPARVQAPQDFDPALLARISRGVRRPLNAVIGFSELISSQTFGALGDERYGAYAEDIARAGQEIAALVDELDDYTRLREGRYLPQRSSLDLTSLLEGCVVRIRAQANVARVIVRNAISESLPKVTCDRPSMVQAVLNLLSSAIDQTPTGGTVVISAQKLDDGGIAIHVRDSSVHSVDMAERFVVFRDGTDRTGQALAPVRSSVGLALTRSLLAVNAVSLSVDPAGREGMLFTLRIPADLVERKNERPEEQQN